MTKQETDILVVGSGLTGMLTAISLASLNLKVTIIESNDLNKLDFSSSDGRASAISYGSKKILDQFGIWDKIEKHTSPILDIRVSDDNSRSFVHYDHKIVGDNPMGYMICNHHILGNLLELVRNNKNINLISPVNWKSFDKSNSNMKAKLDNGQTIQAKLAIAADGKFSKTRDYFNFKCLEHDYKQTGIVCTIKHEKHHNFLAQERFLPTGPFAVLPLKGGHHSSLVWVEKPNLAKLYVELDKNEIEQQISKRVGNYLGEIKLDSKIFSYPLILKNANHYIQDRIILAGDAAHGIHPLAGQGYNLGIRDVKVIFDIIEQNLKSGNDIATIENLNEYEKLRNFDSYSMIAITHLLNALFLKNNLLFKLSRRIGLKTVNGSNKIKKFLIKHAMGI